MPELMKPGGRTNGLGYAAEFTPALLQPDRSEPGLIAGPNGKAAKKRYNVYRNNVTVSLVNALADTFPAVQRIVGEEFFRAMARLYIRQTPPTSPLLFEYGRHFAGFLEEFEHTRSMPYLADVARIERAFLDAYHAADAAPLAPGALAAIPPERIGEAVFTGHPATRIVRSEFPAVTIFAMNRRDGPVGRLGTREPQDALVTRPGLEVIVRRLPPGGAAFVEGLLAGKPLAEAAGIAIAEQLGFDLAANIAGMLEAGTFTAVTCPTEGSETGKEDRT